MGIVDELGGLWRDITRTENHIDSALDTGDRRAFRVWCKKRASLSSRVQRLLLALVYC